VNEATNAIYVANQTDGTFVTVDARAETVTRSVPATVGGSGLFWVDASRRAPYAVYATNFLDNTLTVFERSGTVAGRLSLGAVSNAASGVAVNSTTGKIYVVDSATARRPTAATTRPPTARLSCCAEARATAAALPNRLGRPANFFRNAERSAI